MNEIESLQSKTYTYEVTPENIALFQEVTCFKGDKKLIPPTYATRFRDGEFELLERMGIKLFQVLHGEQSYQYFSPLQINKDVKCVTFLKEKRVKKGGKMIFLIFHTLIKQGSEDSQPCIEAESILIVRS